MLNTWNQVTLQFKRRFSGPRCVICFHFPSSFACLLHFHCKHSLYSLLLSQAGLPHSSQEKRAKGEPTVPSTIAEVFQINPFMRVNEEAVQRHAGSSDPVKVMQILRDGKDTFKPKS